MTLVKQKTTGNIQVVGGSRLKHSISVLILRERIIHNPPTNFGWSFFIAYLRRYVRVLTPHDINTISRD